MNQSNMDINGLLNSMMRDGSMEIPQSGTAMVEVPVILSSLLSSILAPIEIVLLSNTDPSINGPQLYREAVQKANGGISQFGKSMLDAKRLMDIAKQYGTNPSAKMGEQESKRIQQLVLSEMYATFHYIRTEIQKHMNDNIQPDIRIQIEISGEHILYLHMFIMSMMFGIRSNAVNGLDANRIDQLIAELQQKGSVKTNNPIEMLILYLLDITAQYTQKVGKKTITADELKSILTEHGTMNLDKLKNLLQ